MTIKTDITSSIRRASGSDARAFIELFESIAASTPYLGFAAGERSVTLGAQAAAFDNQDKSHDIHLVAAVGEELVGFISVMRTSRIRTRHVGSMVIGVKPAFRQTGIAARLCSAAEAAARSGGLTRLELTVLVANAQAVRLYVAQQFVVEGIRRASMNLGGKCLDEYFMSKLL